MADADHEAGELVKLEEERVTIDDATALDGWESRSSRQRLERVESTLRQSRGRQTTPGQPGRLPGDDGNERRSSSEYEALYDHYVRTGQLDKECRALSAENDLQGGYLVAPKQVHAGIIRAVDNRVAIRQLATVHHTTAQSLGAPSLDSDPADAAWTAELSTGDEDSSMGFGKRELMPHPLAKRLLVTNKLLRLLGPGGEKYVRDRLAYKFAVTEEAAFLTGSGSNQPLGVFTASANGISTARDIVCASSTAIDADSLINAFYSLKSGYTASPSCRWIFSRQAIAQIRKLKDSAGRYLWQPGLVDGQPDRVLGVPVIMSEYAPATFTTGRYVGVLGDFKHYWIADGQQFAIQRLVELYAATNQVAFLGRLECDGMPVLEEAFARLRLA